MSFGTEAFWSSWYENRALSATSSTTNANTKEAEWYASASRTASVLAATLARFPRSWGPNVADSAEQPLRVLVSGCGDSLVGEVLVQAGVLGSNVVVAECLNVDFSAPVIEKMRAR